MCIRDRCGYNDGLKHRSARIIRIAVNPSIQQQGLGKRLVEEAESYAKRHGYEWLGSSFGATEPLVSFWSACGLKPVRVGVSQDGASGSYSTLVVAPLCEAVKPDFVLLRRRFHEHFLLALKNYYQNMSTELLLCFLVRERGECIAGISAVEAMEIKRDVDGFLQYRWPYDVVFPRLQCWFLGLLFKGNIITYSDDISLLMDLFVRQRSIERVAKHWGKGGEKALLKVLKAAVSNANDNTSHLH
ncbi:MAG: GNAT family N-acetyltransferase [Pseudomonadales bacterium]|nr:GNAT family N-acetyltransferase [Pseudomonadales bacterium]